MSAVDVSLPHRANREVRKPDRGAPMTRSVRTTLALLLLSGAAYFAMPAAFPAVDDWQPIDPADLALKDNPKAPGADAMILYGETRVNEPKFFTESYTRMKIFT